jgi:hypothetical protein
MKLILTKIFGAFTHEDDVTCQDLYHCFNQDIHSHHSHHYFHFTKCLNETNFYAQRACCCVLHWTLWTCVFYAQKACCVLHRMLWACLKFVFYMTSTWLLHHLCVKPFAVKLVMFCVEFLLYTNWLCCCSKAHQLLCCSKVSSKFCLLSCLQLKFVVLLLFIHLLYLLIVFMDHSQLTNVVVMLSFMFIIMFLEKWSLGKW